MIHQGGSRSYRTAPHVSTEHRPTETFGVGSEQRTEYRKTEHVERTAPKATKGFVRHCLTETPNIRNTDIQRKASEQGVTISPAYISEIRTAFSSEQTA
jgi:hypothetical protein